LIEAGSGTGFFGVWIWIQSKSSRSTTLVSGVIDTADHKKFDFIVEYLREYEAICKKALTRGSRARWSCLMKKPEVKNLVTGSL
jgi:hypothetical protein